MTDGKRPRLISGVLVFIAIRSESSGVRGKGQFYKFTSVK